MRDRLIGCVVSGVLLALASISAHALPRGPSTSLPAIRFGVTSAPIKTGPRKSVAAYRGIATWVDIYNRAPWRNPERAVRRMKAKGVGTLFLQTGNYSSKGLIHRPHRIARFIHAAHRRDMRAVGWYVPSFDRPTMDSRRSRAAIRFETGRGQRFDSFALDIESTVVARIGRRNRQLLRLANTLRRAAGPWYPLGAIVPDWSSTYWPRFPYRAVARRFDVFLPMAYFTFRAHGPNPVRRYVAANVHTIKRKVAARAARIHLIGGIAGKTTPREVRGFVQAARKHDVLGVSLYDFPITERFEWRAMQRARR